MKKHKIVLNFECNLDGFLGKTLLIYKRKLILCLLFLFLTKMEGKSINSIYFLNIIINNVIIKLKKALLEQLEKYMALIYINFIQNMICFIQNKSLLLTTIIIFYYNLLHFMKQNQLIRILFYKSRLN